MQIRYKQNAFYPFKRSFVNTFVSNPTKLMRPKQLIKTDRPRIWNTDIYMDVRYQSTTLDSANNTACSSI